ncbi:hypothetical protein [Sphingomonas daechungensis]|uniref:hypothetical protein n=1 Tax=Sphingomonas daechungensis TaxID=1176646 RepID=UPI001CB96BAD|nr:hypothetical protein [Sphingomonas daechungensis]
MILAQLQSGDLVKARGRDWIVLDKQERDGLLRVRPLSGSEEDAITIAPLLERQPIVSTAFAPPTAESLDTQEAARLLADALRLSLRRGAGPFRSAAHLGVEPRAYQLVPLLMALRLDTKRLLIADDVGIGKTIEAGMIVREMIDRGEVDRFTVLCPRTWLTSGSGSWRKSSTSMPSRSRPRAPVGWSAALPSQRAYFPPTPIRSSAWTT